MEERFSFFGSLRKTSVVRSLGSQVTFGSFATALFASTAARSFAFPIAAAIWVARGLAVDGTNQVPAGLDGGDCGETQFPCGLNGGVGGNDSSSSLSQMSAHLSDTSPAAEPELTGDELPISVLATLVDVKLHKSVHVKLELYWHKSVYAR